MNPSKDQPVREMKTVEHIPGWIPADFPPEGFHRCEIMYTDGSIDNFFWWNKGELFCIDPNKNLEITHYRIKNIPHETTAG